MTGTAPRAHVGAVNAPPDPDTIPPAAAARLQAAIAADPALRGATPERVIRIVPGKRAILRGTLDGRPAVYRLSLEDGDRTAAREWAEMTRAWPQMNTGNLRIAAPLHFSPAHGVQVIEDVPGTPLMAHLYHLAPEARGGHMEAPAAWLRRYTAPTEQSGKSRAASWLDRAERATATQPHPDLRRLERHVVKELRRILPLTEGEIWRSAICHGDFHPNNLILDAPRLTGIDLGGSARLPIYKDMARFLMHMGRRGLLPSGRARFGVDAEGFDALARAFALTPWEREVALPFMLGVEALIRVENTQMATSRLRRAARMYEALIPDLARV